MRTRPPAPPAWLTSILYQAAISVRQGLQRFLSFAACVGAGGLSAQETVSAGRREAPEGHGVERARGVQTVVFPGRRYQSDWKEGREVRN